MRTQISQSIEMLKSQPSKEEALDELTKSEKLDLLRLLLNRRYPEHEITLGTKIATFVINDKGDDKGVCPKCSDIVQDFQINTEVRDLCILRDDGLHWWHVSEIVCPSCCGLLKRFSGWTSHDIDFGIESYDEDSTEVSLVSKNDANANATIRIQGKLVNAPVTSIPSYKRDYGGEDIVDHFVCAAKGKKDDVAVELEVVHFMNYSDYEDVWVKDIDELIVRHSKFMAEDSPF